MAYSKEIQDAVAWVFHYEMGLCEMLKGMDINASAEKMEKEGFSASDRYDSHYVAFTNPRMRSIKLRAFYNKKDIITRVYCY